MHGSLIPNKEIIISGGERYPFQIQTQIINDVVVSELIMNTAGYCMGGNTFSCWAKNNVKHEMLMQTFKLTPGRLLQNSFQHIINQCRLFNITMK